MTVIPDKLEPAELPGLVFMLKGRIQRTPFNVIDKLPASTSIDTN